MADTSVYLGPVSHNTLVQLGLVRHSITAQYTSCILLLCDIVLFWTMHNRVVLADTLVAMVGSVQRNRGDSGGAHEATQGEEQIFDEDNGDTLTLQGLNVQL